MTATDHTTKLAIIWVIIILCGLFVGVSWRAITWGMIAALLLTIGEWWLQLEDRDVQ